MEAVSIKHDIKGGALTPKISVAYDVAYDTRYQTSYSIEGNAKDGFKILAIALDGAAAAASAVSIGGTATAVASAKA